VDINIIAKDSGLFEKNENTNDVDTQKLAKILQEIKLNEKIIVGHLAPYVLEKNQVKIIIILRRNPYDLESVYKERNYSEIKIKENTGSEVLGIIMHDTIEKFEEKAFQIDISERNIQQVVEKVLEIISKKEGNEEVDWLNLVTKNNDLEKFFTH
jgi:adenylate kinase